MLWYKILGVLLLAVGGFFCAGRMNDRRERSLALTESWISLLEYIKNRVECFCIPIEEILAECDPGLLRSCGYKGEKTPRSLTELPLNDPLLDEGVRDILGEFSREFGRCYKDEQVKRCEYFISSLEGKRRAEREKLPERKRLNTTLWLTGSLALAIILL